MKQMNFMVLIEHDFGARNFAGYVPALRLSAVGDTKEEMLQNLKDIIVMELEQASEVTYHEHSYEMLQTGENKTLNVNDVNLIKPNKGL